MAEVKASEAVIDLAPGRKISLTDENARAMSTNTRSSGNVGYNVQTAVDTKHHLIVGHDESMAIGDRGVTPYAPKTLTSSNWKHVLFDRGDFIHIEADNEYTCLANKRLAQRTKMMEASKVMLRYWSK